MGCIVYKVDRRRIRDISASRFFDVPAKYHDDLLKAVGDWVVFYMPRDGSTAPFYSACARIAAVDTGDAPKTVRALIKDFDWFERNVPAFAGQYVYEPELIGRNWRSVAQRAVRPVSEAQCLQIAEDGFAHHQPEEKSVFASGFGEAAPLYIVDPRSREKAYRLLRDLRLRAEHRSVYGGVCSLSGTCQPNGRGGFEAQCAHILPVADGGPDIISNTLCLSATFHWCWDSGLVALDDNYRILISSLLCDSLRRQLNTSGYAIVPSDSGKRPGTAFLRWHRERWASNFS